MYVYKHILRIIIFAISTACFHGCRKDTSSKAFFDIISNSISDKKEHTIIAYDIGHESTTTYLTNHKNIEYCDLTAPENYLIRCMLRTDRTLEIHVSEGEIRSINEARGKINVEDKPHKKGSGIIEEDFLEFLNTGIKATRCNDDTSKETINEIIDNLQKLASIDKVMTSFFLLQLYRILEDKDSQNKLEAELRNNTTLLKYDCYQPLLESLPQRVEAPRIYIPEKVINLGAIDQHSTKEKSINITNTSKTELQLYRIAVSCSCIEASYNRVIPPEQKDSIRIRFHADDDVGDFSKYIILTTNSMQKNIRLTIKGSIIKQKDHEN